MEEKKEEKPLKKKGEVVSKEVAEQEVEKWLDYKKYDEEENEELMQRKETLARAISLGHLTLEKDFSLKHNLKFPITDDEGKPLLSEMRYKPRLKMSEVETKMKGIDTKVGLSVIGAYVAALTDQSNGLIKKLDSSDNKIAQSVAGFFL